MQLIFRKFTMVPMILCLICLNAACKHKKNVILSVNFIEPYCGGAPPTPEMEKSAQTPQPYLNKKVFFVSNKGEIDSVTTDQMGKAQVKLKSGIYNFYEEWRFKKQSANGAPLNQFDKDCLKTEWALSFLVLTVNGSTVIQKEKQTITNYCPHNIPCILESFKPPIPE